MGLRGIGVGGAGGAPTWRERQRQLEDFRSQEQPWTKPFKRWMKVLAFCESLSITQGKDAFTKMKLRDWQVDFIRQVYAENRQGVRAVRTAVLSMARKNGKTQLAAALALCHLCGPESENRGEVYSCANDRNQASKIFNEMVALISNHPWLTARCNVIRFRKEIEDLENGSIYQALSREAKTKMGFNPSFVVYDELGQASDRDLFDAMDSALGARKEPLLLVISTQAADDFAPLSQLIDYGLKVRRGDGDMKDPAFHVTLYTAPDNADPFSKRAWKAANPALDDFLSLEHVERMAKQARRMPARENSFRNLVLNQRIAAETRFLTSVVWRTCGEEVHIPQGVRVYAGLDLGATRDLSALVIVWGDSNGVYHVKPYCWIPGNLKERESEDKVPYEQWAREGLIYPMGVATDPRVIANKLGEINGVNHIEALAFDRWRIGDLKRELDAIGLALTLEPHGQGFKDMTSAVDVVERLVTQHKLRHGLHPVLTMCALNAVVTRDPAGGRKFDKSKSGGRIDALVAMAMALNLALTRAQPVFDVEAMIG
jgi:phage terminase large subunit-like protein